ncbi:uncharacterized protein VDAG_09432 [Verticillium dahliae VdLs.17]|uniref:Uncharacterized protein n=1 Tax=Verticillium dahliae (strain VdLs.17 / ATCC MYA-4575 / FGSC 10137) TaxID=498257 RepID=G2XH00_VERDV|nr:uncharacterized protein VDAG_09432 [Verticillium dahliae VdLs.17]EGY19098.1 hypothetical protein VDAG_09432 [Verticillium dahliae VdLs.17]KAH6688653.1 hypothetical protein EV126DRAFT_445673 [Verticillium dahliae]
MACYNPCNVRQTPVVIVNNPAQAGLHAGLHNISSMDQSMDHLSAAVETTAATGHSTSMVAWHDSRTDDIRTQRWRSGQDGSVLVRRALLTGMRMMVFPIMATS